VVSDCLLGDRLPEFQQIIGEDVRIFEDEDFRLRGHDYYR